MLRSPRTSIGKSCWGNTSEGETVLGWPLEIQYVFVQTKQIVSSFKTSLLGVKIYCHEVTPFKKKMEQLKQHLITFGEHKLQPKIYNRQLRGEKNIYSCEKQEDNSSKEEGSEGRQYEENFQPR